MKKCYLAGYGNCGGKLSAEHYISKSVLTQIAKNGTIQIGGLPFQPKDTFQIFGIESLVANILCQSHNCDLSHLDEVAKDFFFALNAVDKEPDKVADLFSVNGRLVERWLLKILCGMAAGIGSNNGVVSENWAKLLLGQKWPAGWGLYVPSPPGPIVLAGECYIATKINPATKEVVAAHFRVAGVHLHLLLGRPFPHEMWGNYRPRGFIFRDSFGVNKEKRVEFDWPFKTNVAVIYIRQGTTVHGVPQWEGWKPA